MTETTPATLRRRAIALAAMLTATVLTAIAAVGGLTRWSGPPPAGSQPPAASVIQPAPAAAPQTVEVDD
jgi:hypothetical protein